MDHLAILKPRYLDAILDGRKTIECRLMRNRVPPFGLVRPGDRIFLKDSGGPIRGVARAAAVRDLSGLTPASILDLEREFNGRVLGDAEFWRKKAGARYGTLIWLGGVSPWAGECRHGRRGARSAWIAGIRAGKARAATV
ncbi:MAG: ASCH domain-containing protein [Phycisphaeraceae bacterium]|nr:MAG: ASCH domain-containing protein [Phycisphaeraceae bacterium]